MFHIHFSFCWGAWLEFIWYTCNSNSVYTCMHVCMHACIHTYIRTYVHNIPYVTLHYITLHCIALHCIASHTSIHPSIHTYIHYIYIHIYIQSYDHPSWNRIKSYLIPSFFFFFVCIYFKFDRVYVYIVFQHQISWRSPRTSVPVGSITVPSENRTTKGAGFYPTIDRSSSH